MRFGNPGDPFKEDWGPYGCAKNWKDFPGYNKHDLCRHKCRPEDMKQCQGCGYWFCEADWAQKFGPGTPFAKSVVSQNLSGAVMTAFVPQ